MKNLKNMSKRALALLLTLIMCLSMANFTALAAVDETEPEAALVVDVQNPDGSGLDTNEPGQGTEPEQGTDGTEQGTEEPGQGTDGTEQGTDGTGQGTDGTGQGTDGTEQGTEPEQGTDGNEQGTDGTEQGTDGTEQVTEETNKAESTVPETVQAFLDAVAKLPEAVTEENAEEVATLMADCQDAYDALSAEDLEREDVKAAVETMTALMEPAVTTENSSDCFGVKTYGEHHFDWYAGYEGYPEYNCCWYCKLPEDVFDFLNTVEELPKDNTAVDFLAQLKAQMKTCRDSYKRMPDELKTREDVIEAYNSMVALSSATGEAEYTPVTGSETKTGLLLDMVDLAVANGGTVKLLKDVQFESRYDCIEIVGGKPVVLDLGGRAIDANQKWCVISLTKGADLTLKDSVGGGKITGGKSNYGGGIYVMQSTFTLESGTICGNTDTNKSNGGGGIFANSSSTVTIKGGTISDNTANKGGGVFIKVKSSLTMNNGAISGNEAVAYGGGVYVDSNSTFTMDENTVISGNTASNGGGVFIQSTATGTIKGGKIIDNTATCVNQEQASIYPYGGGGIYVNGGKTAKNGKLYLYNVEITGNTAKGNGYGGSGIGSCPTSNVTMYLSSGGAIYGNSSNVPQVFVNSDVGGTKAYLSAYMLGGASYSWTQKDGTTPLDHVGEWWTLGKAEQINAYNANTKADLPEGLAKVVISGNKSAMGGGGIGANGTVIIGEDKGVLILSKAVAGSDKDAHKDDVFEFTVTVGGKAQTVTLKAGETKAIGGLELGTSFTVVENTTGASSVTAKVDGVAVEPDENGKIVASGTIGKTESQGVVEVEFTNEYKAPPVYYVYTNYVTLDHEGNIVSIDNKDTDKNLPRGDGDENGKWTGKWGETYEVSETEGGKHYAGSYTHYGKYDYTYWADFDTKFDLTQDIFNGYYAPSVKVSLPADSEADSTEHRLVMWYVRQLPGPETPPTTPSNPTGSLTIEKSIVGGGEDVAKKVFTFTVTGPRSYSKTVTITGSGKKTLSGLTPGKYTVTEGDAEIAGYELMTTGEGEVEVVAYKTSTAAIENTYTEKTPTTGVLSVEKVWLGDAGANRPDSVTVQILKDGTVVEIVTLNDANNWSWSKVLSEEDLKSQWTVSEIDVPEGYTSSVSADGTSFTVTNSYGTTDIPEDPTPSTDVPDNPPPLIDWPVEQPPLVEVPEVPVPTVPAEPEVDIPEGPTPMVGVPQTGDISLAWYAMAILSACGLIVLMLKKREGEEN